MNQKPYAENYIPLTECEARVVYKVVSRNLTYAVYNGKNGFIGIREKWGSKYLFTEYHWDQGAPYGTVCPQERVEFLPDDIQLRERMPTVDQRSNREVEFDAPVVDGGLGWYFIDTGEPSTEIIPVSSTYKPLYDYLDALEKQNEEGENKQ